MEHKYQALVVDDEPMVLRATVRALSRRGFSCREASDGEAAWELAQHNAFDVVISDLRMPVANGHQLAVQILALPERPTLVILTGVVEPRLANDLRIRGVDDILFKPIDYDVLAQRVIGFVEQRRNTLAQAVVADVDRSVESEATQEAGAAANPQIPEFRARREDLQTIAPSKEPSAIPKRGAKMRPAPVANDAAMRAAGASVDTDASAPSNSRTAKKSRPHRKLGWNFDLLRKIQQFAHDAQGALARLRTCVAASIFNPFLRNGLVFAAGVVVGWLIH